MVKAVVPEGRPDISVDFKGTSVSPKLVSFSKQDEHEKTILVSNNSASVLELKSFYSETSAIKIEPIPTTRPPGQQAQLKVKQTRETSSLNVRDNISISFAKAVEDVPSIGITAIINPVQPEKKKSDDPAANIPGLDELIQKNKPKLPNQ